MRSLQQQPQYHIAASCPLTMLNALATGSPGAVAQRWLFEGGQLEPVLARWGAMTDTGILLRPEVFLLLPRKMAAIRRFQELDPVLGKRRLPLYFMQLPPTALVTLDNLIVDETLREVMRVRSLCHVFCIWLLRLQSGVHLGKLVKGAGRVVADAAAISSVGQRHPQVL